MDILSYNKSAWNKQVEQGNRWTIPVSPEQVASARNGIWSLLLTPTKPVPRNWFPNDLHGINILCLASGGGQQAPILAAAGANVTSLDNSPLQLERDRQVAQREKLEITTIEGDMADLSMFPNEEFDLIFHPVSNVFVPDVLRVWREAYRVVRRGGSLLAGITNPLLYLFDSEKAERGIFEVRHKLPYSDLDHQDESRLLEQIRNGYPLEFSHTLEEQIGGQIQAGFVITGFYEDLDPETPLSQFTPTYFATQAKKL